MGYYNGADHAGQTYNELLVDNFEIVEASENSKPYTKQGIVPFRMHLPPVVVVDLQQLLK